MSEPTWPVRFILPHPTSPRVLLLRGGQGLRLPLVETPPSPWERLARQVARAVGEQFGATATVLRCAEFQFDSDENAREATFVLENHDPAWQPPSDARWCDRSDAMQVLPVGTAGRDAVLRWFDELRGGAISPLRPPWARTGWYARAVSWGEGELVALGRRPSGRVEQMKQWSISSILRFETDAGDAWLKAVPGFFAHEGALIELLATSMPGAVPKVLAREGERGWVLLDTIPGEKLRKTQDESKMAEALRVLAHLQQELAARTSELLSIGCHDRRLATLDGELELLLRRPDVHSDLSGEEIARLEAFAAEVPDRTKALVACGLPETLVHGDLHAGNVTDGGGGVVLFDWTDGCVAHPFMDLTTFLRRDAGVGANETLQQAYLDAWSSYVPKAKLAEALELAGPIACLHHAISYQRILDGIEPADRWEFAGSVQRWLRRLLAEEGANAG